MTFFTSMEQLYNDHTRAIIIALVCLFALTLLIIGIVIIVRRRREAIPEKNNKNNIELN